MNIDAIGEPSFSVQTHCLGHGNPARSSAWAAALGQPEAPDGFFYIMDAECEPVALVPEDLVEAFVAFLNADLVEEVSRLTSVYAASDKHCGELIADIDKLERILERR